MPLKKRCLIVIGGTGKGLLGNKEALDLDFEWQIDVSSEMLTGYETKVDKRVKTVARVFADLKPHFSAEWQTKNDPYLQTGFMGTPAVAQFKFLQTSANNSDLADGLAQSPAIGSLVIKHATNGEMLDGEFAPLLISLTRGSTLEVWIVSSTAGGTGAGLHRHIASKISRLVKERVHEGNVRFFFVQCGQHTYSTHGPSTVPNTFLTIAADMAFMHLQSNYYNDMTGNFYYFDIEPRQAGEPDEKSRRAEQIAMYVKVLMMELAAKDMRQQVVNIQGAKVLVFQAGFWGKDFNTLQTSRATLHALNQSLKTLILDDSIPNSPKSGQVYIEGREKTCVFIDAPPDQRDSLRAMKAKLTPAAINTWLQARNLVPRTAKASLANLLEAWKEIFEKLLDIESLSQIPIAFALKPSTVADKDRPAQLVFQHENEAPAPAPVPPINHTRPLVFEEIREAETLSATWEADVNWAQEIRSWCTYLSTGSMGTNGNDHCDLEAKFLAKAKAADSITTNILTKFRGNTRNATELAPLFQNLLEYLVQLTLLRILKETTESALETHLKGARKVQAKVATLLADLGSAHHSPNSPVEIARLSDHLNLRAQSWLKVLTTKVDDPEINFKTEVNRGANRLSRTGLTEVLALAPDATPEQIAKKLGTVPTIQTGAAGPNQAIPPIWWQQTEPPLNRNYAALRYVILPEIPTTLVGDLGPLSALNQITYEKFGRVGLYVMYLMAGNMNKEVGDHHTAPAYLMRPFVTTMKNLLSTWEDNDTAIGRPTGNLPIALAGAVGEPLDLTSLKASGLTEKEVMKLSKYYILYEKTTNTLINDEAAAQAAYQRTTEEFIKPPQL